MQMEIYPPGGISWRVIPVPPILSAKTRRGIRNWTRTLSRRVLFPNLLLEHVYVPSRIPLGQWRAISESANVFVVAGMIDELAHRSGIDPVDFWLQLIGESSEVQITEKFALDTSRLRKVIRMAAEAANWKGPLPKGRGRGIAATYTQGAWIAEVAEVTVTGDRLSVDRVVAAVDCGLVINPPGAEAQVQGAIMDGLSAALTGKITVAEGMVEQSNFHGLPTVTHAPGARR